jgi:16S rRNA U1498 N3-methylase RsmE
MQGIPAHWDLALQEKEIRRLIRTCLEIGANRFQYIRLHRVHTRDRPLQPVNADPPLLRIHISSLQQSNLRRSQPMPIRYKKNCLVTLRPNHLEQLPQLILCEEVDSTRIRMSNTRRGVRPDSGR